MSKSPARPTEPQLLSMGKLILLANTFAYLLAYLLAYLPTCLHTCLRTCLLPPTEPQLFAYLMITLSDEIFYLMNEMQARGSVSR